MEQKTTDEFISMYNRLDAYMRKTLKVDRFIEHSTLLREMSQKNRIFQDYLQDLRMFAEMRNMLIHNPYKKDADPLIYPHAYIVKKYAQILDLVLHPPKALSIAVRREFIYTTALHHNALEVMRVMDEKTYTHVPVLAKDTLIGVFSENTVLAYLVNKKDVIIPKETTIAEFADLIPLSMHKSEYFEFIPRNALLSTVEEIFRSNLKQRKRVSVVFITETGKQTEKILGIITAWDVAGASK